MEMVVRAHFDAAHYLPDYEGKCRNLHGHRWEVWVSLDVTEAYRESKTGMSIDFKKVKGKIDKVLEEFDHSLLNDLLPHPTAENLAKMLAYRIKESFVVNFRAVQVFETPECSIIVREDEL